jgi:Rha family phage regulatory protein
MTIASAKNLSAMLDIERFVMIKDDRPVTTSMKVAEAFGKQHKDVLKKVQTIECSDEFNGRNFAPIDYIDARGRRKPAYEMTKDGFMFLVMGFTGPKAAAIKEAYIEVFNQMAEALEAERAAQTAHEWILGDFTGEGVLLDFGRGKVYAEYCDNGQLWLADWEIDRLLGYKMPNATRLLFFRNKTNFPQDSFEILENDDGSICVLFTPRAWAIIARYSQSARADQFALAAVQYYVTPGKVEVDRHDYLSMAEYTLEARDRLRRLADESRGVFMGAQEARDFTEDASFCIDQEKAGPIEK